MKRFIYSLIIAILGCLLLINSTSDELESVVKPGDSKEISVVLNFGASNHSQIEINSRNTYQLHYESMVRNLYVFVFANNHKIYGRYFDSEKLNKTNEKEYWTVTNMTSENTSQQTTGTIRMTVGTAKACPAWMTAHRMRL